MESSTVLVFKTGSKTYFRYALLNWIELLVICSLLLLIFNTFKHLSVSDVLFIATFLSLTTLSRAFVPYYIYEINVAKEHQTFTVILRSRISGKEVKTYALNEVSAKVKPNSMLEKLKGNKHTLKIYVPGNKFYKISSRYGFESNVLLAVEKQLESALA